MKQKVGAVRIIVTIILLVLAVYLFVGAYVTWTELTEAQGAEPVQMEVDFSSPGKYSSSLRTVSPLALGIRLQLKFDSSPSEETERSWKLDGLEGQMYITDDKGQVRATRHFTGDDFRLLSPIDEGKSCSSIGLIFAGRQEKDWTISVDIAQPASALKDTHQLLTGRYLICGFTIAGPTIAMLGGLICGGVAIKIMRPRQKKSESAPGREAHLDNVS